MTNVKCRKREPPLESRHLLRMCPLEDFRGEIVIYSVFYNGFHPLIPSRGTVILKYRFDVNIVTFILEKIRSWVKSTPTLLPC